MTNPQIPSANAPKKRGCFFYGCLTLVIITVLLGVAAFFTVRYALGKVNALVEQYTDTRPAVLPKVEMDPAEYEKLEQRLADFKAVLDGQKEGGPLTLTAQDLNGLIAHHPAMQQWKDRLYVTIDGDQVKGQVSVPLAEVANFPGLSRLQGRYLNGSAALKVSLEGGVPLPEEVMGALRAENLAKDAAREPQAAETLQKLDRLEIQDGVVTLKTRTSSVPAESPQ
jgi:hypothetical protein